MRKYGIDNPDCEVCGCPAVDVHHIKSRGRGGDDIPDNLISLCRDCHTKAHKNMKSTKWLYDAKEKKGFTDWGC